MLTAAFVLGAQLAETAHVEAKHVVCPEHGKLVHVRAPIGAPTQTDAVASLEAHEGHEAHCAHAFAAPHLTAKPQGPVVATVSAGQTIPGSHPARPTIALLRLAPKSSPPRLA